MNYITMCVCVYEGVEKPFGRFHMFTNSVFLFVALGNEMRGTYFLRMSWKVAYLTLANNVRQEGKMQGPWVHRNNQSDERRRTAFWCFTQRKISLHNYGIQFMVLKALYIERGELLNHH